MIRKIFKNQIYHAASFLVLSMILYFTIPGLEHSGEKLLGFTAPGWVLVSWISAAFFQTWIFIFWRLELYYGKISLHFGKYGFLIFKTGFIILAVIRLFPIILISVLSPGTLIIPHWTALLFIALTTPFILWALYSVVFYFGLNRTFGADHFFPEYRIKNLEKRGTFRFIPNSMYTIILLLLYHPPLLFSSSLGLISAIIQHIFVWVHYFCTEKPDIREIYN